MWCSGVFFNGYVGVAEPAQAQENTIWTITAEATGNGGNTQSLNNMWLWQILNLILKIIYLLLWPLLVVAGIALDNTLVYASVFHLDAPLWKFRNMMKNFANFALWFMVLFAIIKNLFMAKDEKWPIDIIKKTLIAGVLIQASRFLMAALIDVSTIATYAVGWLPLSVLKNTDIGKQKILTVNSEINLNKFNALSKKSEGFKVRYSTQYNGKTIKISPCKVEKSFIVGRELSDPEYINFKNFEWTPYSWYEVCVLFGNQLVMRKESAFMSGTNSLIAQHTVPPVTGDYTTPGWYEKLMTTFLNMTGWHLTGWVTGTLVSLNWWSNQTGFTQWKNFFDQSTSITISDLINKSKWFVGPLVTMYSSLLNFAQLTDTSVTSISETSGIFLIKTWVAIALFFPLLALAVVLIARVALLWLYIVWSPFLVIKKVFSDFIPKDALGSLGKHLDINNVFKLIFAPVVTVAALSISLIFMTALINGFKSGDNQQISSNVSESLQIEPIPAAIGNQAFRVGWSSELEFKNFDRWGSLDRFSWLIVNFFAIGLLRTILFAAIKANALGANIGKEIQEFGANVFQTMPVLPFGKWWERVGVGAAWDVLSARPREYIQERETKDKQNVEALFKEPEPTTTITADQATKIATNLWSMEFEKATTEAWVAIPTAWITGLSNQENISAVYKALNEVYTDEQERKKAAANANTIFGEWRYDKQTASLAKEKVDALFTKATNEADITSITQNATSKTDLDAYFKIPGNVKYTTAAIGDTTYDITQKTDWTYAAVKTSATITPQETELKKLIGTAADKAALDAIFTTNLTANKSTIDAYFTAAGKDTYEIPIGPKTFIITKTLDPTDATKTKFTYPVTEK